MNIKRIAKINTRFLKNETGRLILSCSSVESTNKNTDGKRWSRDKEEEHFKTIC